MISEPCRECGNTFWVDEDSIPQEVDRQLAMRVYPYCDGTGYHHSFKLWAYSKTTLEDDLPTFDIRS